MWYDDEESIEEFKIWLEKPEWTKREAVLLLAGVLPDDKYTPYKWVSTPYYDRFVACQYQGQYDDVIAQNEDLINDALHIVEWQAMRESTSYDKGAPLWWLQWFCNEGILNDKVVWSVLEKNGLNLYPQENSRIIKYYRKWASKEAWSFHNTVALLCRKCTDDTDCGLGGFTYDPFGYSGCDLSRSAFYGKYSVEDVSSKLRDTIASEGIEFIEVDRFSHIERRIKPSDAVKWAESRGYNYPKLLMEVLGYKTKPSPNGMHASKIQSKCEEILKDLFKKNKRECNLQGLCKKQDFYDLILNQLSLSESVFSFKKFGRIWDKLPNKPKWVSAPGPRERIAR